MAAAISLDTTALGAFSGYDLVGTLPRPGSDAAQTVGHFRFAEGSYFVELEWNGETIDGASLNVPHPLRVILRTGEGSELVGYDFRHQSAIRLRAQGNDADEIIISSPGGAVRAKRAGF
jgi:hypothetical protein